MIEEPLDTRVLRRLVESPETLSRNQNFHAFDNAAGRRLLRLAARLRSLIAALRSPAATVRWYPVDREFVITIDDTSTGVHRETRLDHVAFSVLRENAEARRALGEPSDEPRAPLRTH